jgi:hypothetical protein
MIEILLLIAFMFLIYAFFYKQSINEYSINQIEFNNLEKLEELLHDKLPIVIRDYPLPKCLTKEGILSNRQIVNVIGNYLEKTDPILPNKKEFETYMASEVGFHVYGQHMILPRFHTNILSEFITTFKTRLCFGSKALQYVKAIYTMIIVVEGNYVCSLINNDYFKGINENWKNCESIELVTNSKKQIQFMDIKLKPNTVLILPAHWLYLMKEQEPYSYYAQFEYHEPISLLMDYLDN